MDNNDVKELSPISSNTETALDIAALVGSAVPWIGGPVSNVLGGISLGRKLKRVREVLVSVANDLSEFESNVSKNYVQTDEFEELLEQTLKRVSEEINENKRAIYRAFLTIAIKSPGDVQYDDQVLMLRSLDELKLDHLSILKAVRQEPKHSVDTKIITSPSRTLIEPTHKLKTIIKNDIFAVLIRGDRGFLASRALKTGSFCP